MRALTTKGSSRLSAPEPTRGDNGLARVALPARTVATPLNTFDCIFWWRLLRTELGVAAL